MCVNGTVHIIVHAYVHITTIATGLTALYVVVKATTSSYREGACGTYAHFLAQLVDLPPTTNCFRSLECIQIT